MKTGEKINGEQFEIVVRAEHIDLTVHSPFFFLLLSPPFQTAEFVCLQTRCVAIFEFPGMC